MLRLIEGGVGAGKTGRIREEIAGYLRAGGQEALLLVPEQASFETERSFETFLDGDMESAGRLLVLSFNRLANEIFRTCGGLAGRYADDPARLLVMKLALSECQGELKAYARVSQKNDFALEALRAIEEFKNAGISPADAAQAAGALEEGALRDKLSDLSLLYEGYEALLGQRYRDPLDDLSRAARLARENRFFAGKMIWLDEFKGFTGIQGILIGEMLSQGATVTVSLALEEGDDSLFYSVRETRKKLLGIAARVGSRVESPVKLPTPEDPSPLSHFARNALHRAPVPFKGKQEAVRCALLTHEFEEAQYTAAQIMNLVREGCRFEDIAVIGRNEESFGPIFAAAFERYEIPFLSSLKKDISGMPLARFVRYLLQMMVTGCGRTEVLSFLKCGYTPLSLDEIHAFESYTYVWNITGKRFFTPFTQNPLGFSDREMGEGEKEELLKAEKVRSLTVEVVGLFKDELAQTGSFPRGIYQVFTHLSLAERIAAQALRLREEGRQGESDDLTRTWDGVMGLLSTAENILAGREVTAREFCAYFTLGAGACELGKIPQTLDSVLMGSADRIRLNGKKYVFIVGANDGEFPLLPDRGGLFTAEERQALETCGLSLPGAGAGDLAEERFIAYKALTAASKGVFISHTMGDIAGRERYPSPIVETFQAVFPDCGEEKAAGLTPEFFSRTERTLFLQYLSRCREDTPFSRAARRLLTESPGCRERVLKLEDAASKGRFTLRDADLAKALFGGDKTLSPSQVERYFRCPFGYFCRYGLGLKVRGKAELNPLSRGSIIHYLLEQLLREDFFSLSDEALSRKVSAFLETYIKTTLGEASQDSRLLYHVRRMKKPIVRIFSALRAEFSQMEFKVAGLEEPVGGPGSRIAPLTIPTENGTVRIVGKIDRIDQLLLDGENYVRVVDYKSGGKKFELGAVAEGLNLQMLLYLFSIKEGGRGPFKGAKPAGILYMPAGSLNPSLPREAGEEETKVAAEEGFTMNGLLLDDQRVLVAMEPDLAGRFLPVSLGKGGLKGRYAVSQKDFETIEGHVRGLVREMARLLEAGQVAPDPLGDGGFVPCDSCEYRPVCGREEGEDCRKIRGMTLEELRSVCEEGE